LNQVAMVWRELLAGRRLAVHRAQLLHDRRELVGRGLITGRASARARRAVALRLRCDVAARGAGARDGAGACGAFLFASSPMVLVRLHRHRLGAQELEQRIKTVSPEMMWIEAPGSRASRSPM